MRPRSTPTVRVGRVHSHVRHFHLGNETDEPLAARAALEGRALRRPLKGLRLAHPHAPDLRDGQIAIDQCHALRNAETRRIRLFAYPRFVEPLREEIRQNTARLAREHRLESAFIRATHAFRKEDRIRAILDARGDQPGLAHIVAAMESRAAFTPRHDKARGKTTLRDKDGKCLHDDVYLIDEECGLCYLRVPTWAPFRLQCYCNGHTWLAGQLRQRSITVEPLDNTFRL